MPLKKNIIRSSLVVASALYLAGCATQNAELQPQFYPECYQPIEQIQQDHNYVQEAKQAATGALAGALIGGIAGAIAGDSKTAAYGAAAGAVVGGMAGFIHARLDKIADQEQRLKELQTMLGDEAKNLDLDKASVLKSFHCYSGEIDVISQALKEKSMTPEEAQVRLAEIRTSLNTAKQFWTEHSAQIDKRINGFDDYIKTQEAQARQANQLKNIKAVQASSKSQAGLSKQLKVANSEVENSYQDTLNKLNVMLAA